MNKKISRALISVSDKTGIIELCQNLDNLGVELLSTGGTAKFLHENNIRVTEISEYTGFPEMLDGRVKTLHPKVHGGILGRRGIDDTILLEYGIPFIDLVVVNLYPFQETIAKPNCDLETAIENIDIGGPTLIRSAAKNNQDVAVLVDPKDYSNIITELLENQSSLNQTTRLKLAAKSFEHIASYDMAIAAYFRQMDNNELPETLNLEFYRVQSLRYGENPHQKAAFYQIKTPEKGSVASAIQLQGKDLSYNNIADADAALECVKSFSNQPACVIVKHANPCGVAISDSLLNAYNLAYATDSTSAFGGIIAFNQELDEKTALQIINNQFVEVIIAPSINQNALSVFNKKPNIRILVSGFWSELNKSKFDYKGVNSGLLVQEKDQGMITALDIQVVTQRKPTEREVQDMLFAWKVAKFVKSNAIVYAKNGQTIGIGAGQMSRVYSARIAGIKAADEGLVVAGSVMASDAFFPFRDGIDAAVTAGITAVIQPGGSLKDVDVIAAANEHNLAMVFTGIRHFRH